MKVTLISHTPKPEKLVATAAKLCYSCGTISETEENLAKKKELWDYLKKKDWLLYRKLRFGLLGQCTNLPGKGGRMISVEGYKICRRFFNFN